MKRESIIQGLSELRDTYYSEVCKSANNLSEETIRSGYLNKVLELFGWNLSKTSQVIQEKKLTGSTRRRLEAIGSTHSKPDYRLLDRGVLRMYIDAKAAPKDFRNSSDIAFQIRSYGWSSQVPLSMVSNFEYFAIYDTTFKPNNEMKANYRSFNFKIDDLIDEFDLYSQFFDINSVQKGTWNLEPFELELHSNDSKSLDVDFLNLIDNFRLNLGNGISRKYPDLVDTTINYYIQIIINRILFIRILEDIDMEPKGRLKDWLNNGRGFWLQFHKSSKEEFYLKYDGALFEQQIPDFVNIEDDNFIQFINSLYGDTPYKFDVIEPALIAEIYDIFLGKKLTIESSGEVSIVHQDLSPAGSVPTPAELSTYLADKVLNLKAYKTVESLLQIRILDPCAGSGSFLVAAFDGVLHRIREIEGHDQVSYDLVKSIIQNCLYGVDIDPVAIEVLKMTISLKLVMSNYKPMEPIENMLSDFAKNFQLGNSIVDTKIYENIGDKFSREERMEQKPTDYENIFSSVMSSGGFTHILINPPYVEPKHFKKRWPETYQYLKETYVSSTGKSDISLFFLERVFDFLNEDGKVGVVIQRRFFNTDYGKKIRKWLAEKGFLTEIKEYRTNNLFKNKTTYVALLVAHKKYSEYLNYQVSLKEVEEGRGNLLNVIESVDDSLKISSLDLLYAPKWSYRYFRVSKILNTLGDGFFTLNSSKRFKVTVGPQVLDKKYYVLYNAVIHEGIVTGYNKLGELVSIEEGLVRALYENDKMNSFTKFKHEGFTTFLIFPYDDKGVLITLNRLMDGYPLGVRYFQKVRSNTSVRLRPHKDEFYGYTRQQNLGLGNRPKIFVPMTSRRVIASFSEVNVFGDNSNINAIIDEEDDSNLLKAYSVILNSELFSLLTIPIAGDASGGYYKMNKQYIGEVPLPLLTKSEIVELVEIYDEIQLELQSYKVAYGDEKKVIKRAIRNLQSLQNQFVYRKYDFTESDLSMLKENVNMKSLDWFENMVVDMQSAR